MHIREVEGTENLDFDALWEGRENPKDSGPVFWGILHGMAETFPCGTCRPVAKVLASGIHDMTNISVKGYVYDAPTFKEFVRLVHESEAKATPLMTHNPAKAFKHERIEDPTHFDPSSFRMKVEGRHRIVIGCPMGHYSNERCEVGTRQQAILHPLAERKHHG